MKKQKICIIGGSLTGLVTAISLSKLNCKIDLITGNLAKNFESSRTIAVSENNFHFLNKLNISKSLIANKRDLQNLLDNNDSEKLQKGWRYTIFGKKNTKKINLN